MYNRTNVPPSTSGASGAPGFNNQPNPIPLPNVQGNFQNQPVNVVAGPSSYLNPQVQQFTQPQALPPLNWSNATVGAPLIVPGMHRHPHMIVAGTVADFVGETISLDAFTEGRAKQELLDEFTKYFANLNLSSGAQAQQGASTSTLPLTGNQIQQVRQQVESDIRAQAAARNLNLNDVRMTIEDSFPGVSPQQQVFTQDLSQAQVQQRLTAFFAANPDVDRVLCEVNRSDGNGQPSFEGLSREGGRWRAIGRTQPLPAPSLDWQNFRDSTVIDPAAFLANRHVGNTGGNPQRTGLSLLTLTPQQRQSAQAGAVPSSVPNQYSSFNA